MRLIPLAALALLSFLASPVDAGERYYSILIGSKHFGNDQMNNQTPGLTFGQRWPGTRSGTEWFMEGGVFYNSYKEVSPIALFGTSMSIGTIGPTDLRAGVAIGTAYYKKLSGKLQDRHHIPNIGGFIPIAVASLALRHGNNEARLTAVPPDTDTDFILNLSITHKF